MGFIYYSKNCKVNRTHLTHCRAVGLCFIIALSWSKKCILTKLCRAISLLLGLPILTGCGPEPPTVPPPPSSHHRLPIHTVHCSPCIWKESRLLIAQLQDSWLTSVSVILITNKQQCTEKIKRTTVLFSRVEFSCFLANPQFLLTPGLNWRVANTSYLLIKLIGCTIHKT